MDTEKGSKNLNLLVDPTLARLLAERHAATGCSTSEFIRRCVRSGLLAEFANPVKVGVSAWPVEKPKPVDLELLLSGQLEALREKEKP